MSDTCEWFALCDQPAIGTSPHPILGDVPVCKRCANNLGLTVETVIIVGPEHRALVEPHQVDHAEAAAELYALGLTPEQLDYETGFGLRNVYGCRNVDTVLNKYAAGALSRYGVMGSVFGSDSPQHHCGHNLPADTKIMEV